MGTCSAYFLGMPCQVKGPGRECARSWGLVKAGSAFKTMHLGTELNQASWHSAPLKHSDSMSLLLCPNLNSAQ
eukprot:902769-Pelagomonas_calceolata.AAC.4